LRYPCKPLFGNGTRQIVEFTLGIVHQHHENMSGKI
jgi:hypothetical protein